ncbi:Signal transduction histidine kinase [Phyllobacterium sp. YR620]|uniref:sensor histidine kinase n=1 Tax=Phyllobacterium sp. YR620 TaxID=1881066 RepID=UPI00088ED341|nr:ATP-binding protein [Phyllobacterium sp. YR620]SDP43486.1 Signal transduction histidine kinase [Phyllobacterium sp. YR620]
MRRVNLLKSTPFRLAIIVAALFISSFLVAGFVTYQLLKSELAARLDATIQDTYSVLADAYGDHDVTDLVEAVASHANSTSGYDAVYLLRSREGQRLSGNIAQADVPSGWATVDGTVLGLAPGMDYRVYSSAVDEQPLVVGRSFEESREYQEIVRSSFGWATIAVLALAVAGGALLAYRVQRRLESIATTMRDIGSGKLEARIPLVGNGDDVDVVSAQVNDALGRLAALVEGMRQVSSDIAHDLKTPLHRLSLTIDQAIDKTASGGDGNAELVQAKEESNQINATFDALLRIAQIEAGARRARFRPLDLQHCVETIAEIYSEVAADNGQELALRGKSHQPVLVDGDEELLVQLLANTVENAIRHCPRGTAIEIGVGQTGSGVKVEIADNGPGIPESERERVFQRLYRLDKSRTTPGTGLGLSLVKAIADLHHARIELLDNRPGLRIAIQFPLLTSVTDPALQSARSAIDPKGFQS